MHEHLAIHTFAALGLGKSLVDSAAKLLYLDGAQFIFFFHEAERLLHDLTRGVVAARLNLFLDEPFDLGGQMHVYRQASTVLGLRIARMAETVNVRDLRLRKCDRMPDRRRDRNRSQTEKEEAAMSENRFPVGWDEGKVRQVLAHYEVQTEEDAVAEDEAGINSSERVMSVLHDLVPKVRELIAKRQL